MKRRKTMILMAGMLVFSLAAGPSVLAKPIDKVTSDNYFERAGFRLLHGIVNAGLGWTQIFVEPYKSMKHDGQNFVDGTFEGLAYTIYYTALGAWDIGTFWVPGEGGKEIAVKVCVGETFGRT